MRFILTTALILAIIGCGGNDAPVVKNLATAQDSLSYAIGSNMGNQLKNSDLDLTTDAFYQGFVDTYNNSEPILSASEWQKVLRDYEIRVRENQQAASNSQMEKNMSEGRAFLEENAKMEGVITTDSGLQYKIIKQGDGPKPTASDEVEVHYKGSLVDGTQFDSSYDRGETATFGVTQVIPGWTEALQLMNVGSIFEIALPEDIAYGARNQGSIPPYSTLIFTVELVSIK